jgi:hypothetical protein
MRKEIIVLLCLVTLDCSSGGHLVLSRLYFGLNTNDRTISVQEFTAFVDTAITPLFPEGLTRYAAEGQWRDSSGTVVKEPSMVVEIIHPDAKPYGDKLARIIASYKRAYAQESVLLVNDRPRIRF